MSESWICIECDRPMDSNVELPREEQICGCVDFASSRLLLDCRTELKALRTRAETAERLLAEVVDLLEWAADEVTGVKTARRIRAFLKHLATPSTQSDE